MLARAAAVPAGGLRSSYPVCCSWLQGRYRPQLGSCSGGVDLSTKYGSEVQINALAGIGAANAVLVVIVGRTVCVVGVPMGMLMAAAAAVTMEMSVAAPRGLGAFVAVAPAPVAMPAMRHLHYIARLVGAGVATKQGSRRRLRGHRGRPDSKHRNRGNSHGCRQR